MRLAYKYRAYANKQTIENAEHVLELCRRLYNAALANRIECWQDDKDNVSYYDQQKGLTKLRKISPEYASIDFQCERYPLRIIDNSFKGFFRRLKRGEKPGFPRFKGVGRYNSFTMEQNGWRLQGNLLRISHVGTFKLHLSRDIQGDIKTVTLRRTPTGKWYASFSCDNIPERKLRHSKNTVGIDVGIKHFAVDSDGLAIENPKYFRQSACKLRKRQRRLSRRIKGSTGRKQARLLVAKTHEHIKNQRTDFLHKTANYYIKNYGVICLENLNIKGMIRNHNLALSISDGSWGKFFEFLTYKAEYAGRGIIKVDARNTSQICFACGEKVYKTLAERTHKCPYCGLVLDRDENAAKNIRNRGLGHNPHAPTWANTPCVA